MHRLGTVFPFGLNSEITYIKPLTLCPLLYFSCFFHCMLVFFRIKTFFLGFDKSVKLLDLDQARLYVGPDLGPNCLRWLSADRLWNKELKRRHEKKESDIFLSALVICCISLLT